MVVENEDLFRFMFWYCGDSKPTIEDALSQWRRYHSWDEEKIKEYDDFHNELKIQE